ncbi:MAG: tRNA threonylcarbamoyladenosine dehydratase [Paraprevotella sp.]|nr:tRNA threonylcarbamoyladenosine dehydratase [Paraprevotella sp.]MBR2380126.1 tRNA threonylcarbamoyladenosine dehydratase [Paraprevotella sp.]
MITEWTERTELLLGADKMERLKKAHILIVGTGGVGAYAAEMLARAGVGKLTLLDADKVQLSNLNRQVIALHSTLGEDKVRVLERRLKDVNPDLNVTARAEFLEEGSVKTLLTENKFDFVVDAIDTIAPKCALIMEAMRLKVPIVSSMGAGAKTDVTQIRFADLWSTYHCGLSKAVRTRLKKEKMQRPLPVVFCTQQADMNAVVKVEGERNKKTTTGTVSYMPAVFGCYLAQYVISNL